MKIPTLYDIILAAERIKPYMDPSPLYTYPTLNEYLGFTAYVKHENYNPTRAFKIRARAQRREKTRSYNCQYRQPWTKHSSS